MRPTSSPVVANHVPNAGSSCRRKVDALVVLELSVILANRTGIQNCSHHRSVYITLSFVTRTCAMHDHVSKKVKAKGNFRAQRRSTGLALLFL